MKYCLLIFLSVAFWNCNTNHSTNDRTSKTPLPSIETNASDMIRLNQLGYFPNSKKIASVVGGDDLVSFSILDKNAGETVFTGNVGAKKKVKLSGETIQQLDFSDLKKQGLYQIKLDNGWHSHPFLIETDFYNEALTAVAKSFYYQRAGIEITEKYGGQWKRQTGHTDEQVFFHPKTEKTGSISSPKGWYDAGDFGKYISNGSFSAGQLLFTLERYPELYPDGSLNIPESGNGINDLLDEIKYEIDWIATMQDDDGGVFHKLTTKRFSGAIMPHEGNKDRFIMPKSTTATFDFAAVLAKMARHYKAHDTKLSNQWLEQAKKAWAWGVKNPKVNFKNPKDVATGEYGDTNASQEQFWAATELYLATGEQRYLDFIKNNLPDLTYANGDGWQSFMRYLGVFALLNSDNNIQEDIKKELEDRLIKCADHLTNRIKQDEYGQGVTDFKWGSNSDVQNIAFIIGEAHHVSPNPAYIDAVLSSLNYLFGHNAIGYSMITGIGDKSPMNIHHRQSKADGIIVPVPGFVCGGPNHYKQDAKDVDYPADAFQMKSYVDVWESYASNEICLNWNAPTPYVLQFAIEAGK